MNCHRLMIHRPRKKVKKMNYYIADMHLFCRSQVQEGGTNYDGRPFETLEEMHQYFLEHWNAKVTNGDTVYILGDVAFRGKNEELIALVARLKGHKILVRGNHDDLSDYRYAQLFADIVDYAEIKDVAEGKNYKLVLSHYPILFWKDQHRGAILLYGHTHQTAEDTFFQNCIRQMNTDETMQQRRAGEKEIRAINVGAMCLYMFYEPRTLDELLSNNSIAEEGRGGKIISHTKTERGASEVQKVIAVVPNDDYTLTLTFGNGEVRRLDIKRHLSRGRVFDLLMDMERFRRVYINEDFHCVSWDIDPNIDSKQVWDNVIDLCPDSCYRDSVPVDT